MEKTIQDERLVRLAVQGDKAAFEALVLKYRENAVRFAARFTANHFDAEDIVQECFAKLYVRLGQIKAGVSFKAYLYTIIRNQCTDFFRTRNQWSPLCEEELSLISQRGLPEPALLSKEEKEQLQQAIAGLSPDYRAALYLFAVQQMSYQQVAKVMHNTGPQVKITIYRARKALKKSLAEGEFV